MARFPVPLIRSEADYKAIRAIPILDIPDTFNVWAYERDQDTRHHTGPDSIEVPIEVDAAKIRAFCARTGQPANFQAIKDFVWEEFQRQEKARDPR
jgi:hypothetical protein